ncbi:unnamed protein product [Boreogadus saida]
MGQIFKRACKANQTHTWWCITSPLSPGPRRRPAGGGAAVPLSVWPPSNQQQQPVAPALFGPAPPRPGPLGLVKLLEREGITGGSRGAGPPPAMGAPQGSPEGDPGGAGLGADPGRGRVFSLNLVEKLQNLGLHRVAAWGMGGRRRDPP